MRGGSQGMSYKWSPANSYLRLLSSLSSERKKVMIFCTQSDQEQQLVLQAVKQLEARMSSGKVRTVVTSKPDSNVGTIEVSVEDSKEMSS